MNIPVEVINGKICQIRGQNVILDSDLAQMYDVETKVLNQAVKRNRERFPDDFLFQVTEEEIGSLRSQSVTLKPGRGQHRKYLPLRFHRTGGGDALQHPQK
ncbi:MAG TPA: ORF6N domain-containing protein [Pelovirga sp.]|nr:ORF6N domain-containing protein [Pelovirga sp.]